MKGWIAAILLTVAATIFSWAVYEDASKPWVLGSFFGAVFVSIYIGILTGEEFAEQRLFTYFMIQGYSEEAADREIATFEQITPDRWAKRMGGVRRKEREEYERLRKKFDPK